MFPSWTFGFAKIAQFYVRGIRQYTRQAPVTVAVDDVECMKPGEESRMIRDRPAVG